MAVIATGSKFSAQNWLITAAACIVFAGWFAYDGWGNKEYQAKEIRKDGTPTVNLLFNRYAPIPLVIVAVVSLICSAQVKKKKISADDNVITLANGDTFAYGDITRIDKRNFEKGGAFYVEYKQNNSTQTAKFDDRKFDNLGLLLDEIIKQSGAQPEKPAE